MVSYAGQPGSLVVPPRHLSYKQIAADIRERIASGDYAVGEELPSYAEFARIYSCSVSTITRALALLHNEGLVYGEQGRGTFVEDRRPPELLT